MTQKCMREKKTVTTGDMFVRLPMTEDQRYRLKVKVLKQRTTVVGIISDFLMDYIKDEPGLETDSPDTPG